MTTIEQLEAWVKGENVHNHDLNMCCPNFACCQPDGHLSLEERAEFLRLFKEGGQEAIMPMLFKILAGVFGDDSAVCVIGDGETFLIGTNDVPDAPLH